jgi:hypothetical protein
MSPGDLAMGVTLLIYIFGASLVVVAIVNWLKPYPDARPRRACIYWQEYGLTDAHLDEQWIRREHEQDQRQVTLDATQRVLGRLVR